MNIHYLYLEMNDLSRLANNLKKWHVMNETRFIYKCCIVFFFLLKMVEIPWHVPSIRPHGPIPHRARTNKWVWDDYLSQRSRSVRKSISNYRSGVVEAVEMTEFFSRITTSSQVDLYSNRHCSSPFVLKLLPILLLFSRTPPPQLNHSLLSSRQ